MFLLSVYKTKTQNLSNRRILDLYIMKNNGLYKYYLRNVVTPYFFASSLAAGAQDLIFFIRVLLAG